MPENAVLGLTSQGWSMVWMLTLEPKLLLLQVLARAMKGDADSLQGLQVLSHLQLQNEQFDLAAESAAKGLKVLQRRQSKGYYNRATTAAAIVLTRGHSLLGLRCTDDALVMFKALNGVLYHAKKRKEKRSDVIPHHNVSLCHQKQPRLLLCSSTRKMSTYLREFRPCSCKPDILLVLGMEALCCKAGGRPALALASVLQCTNML